ncbi:MAG: hypothetical protein RL748_905 [Pseudomonadota bacterium]|jgi:hypothetical protein
MTFSKPFRFPWCDAMPSVWLHAPESVVKQHFSYAAAKSGDVNAARDLIESVISISTVLALRRLEEIATPVVVSVHAEEAVGVNAIPEVFGDILAFMLGWPVERYIVQTNIVNHTGADGISRIAKQACFAGQIKTGQACLIVDDFIGQGGTIANLRGHIMQQGGSVIGATVLTGKDYSAKLTLDEEQLIELRGKHGQLERWWHERFGFGFDCLTASEARYLGKIRTHEEIRARIESVGA